MVKTNFCYQNSNDAELYLKRCRISRAFRKYKNYFGIERLRVVRGKILKK